METKSRWVDPLAKWEGSHAGLSADEVLQAKKVFAVYTGENSTTVPISSLVLLLRAMGLAPSFLNMRELNPKLPPGPSLSFQQFLDVFAGEKTRAKETLDEVVGMLKSFDHKNDGTLDSNELVSALTTLGETMTEQECSRLLVIADNKGRINIVVLAQFLLSN
jgi:Ca2+-binding EF-hand superfamily protein